MLAWRCNRTELALAVDQARWSSTNLGAILTSRAMTSTGRRAPPICQQCLSLTWSSFSAHCKSGRPSAHVAPCVPPLPRAFVPLEDALQLPILDAPHLRRGASPAPHPAVATFCGYVPNRVALGVRRIGKTPGTSGPRNAEHMMPWGSCAHDQSKTLASKRRTIGQGTEVKSARRVPRKWSESHPEYLSTPSGPVWCCRWQQWCSQY